MVFRLTDFKYEVDLFLFGSGFERFWKLKEGTLLAVLNPGIMPPRVKDTGAFSLKVSSSEDIILEMEINVLLGLTRGRLRCASTTSACRSTKREQTGCSSAQ
jgi:minichromosome maintenance protein 10